MWSTQRTDAATWRRNLFMVFLLTLAELVYHLPG